MHGMNGWLWQVLAWALVGACAGPEPERLDPPLTLALQDGPWAGLTRLDVTLYEAARATCAADGSVTLSGPGFVARQLGIDLSRRREVTFHVGDGSYLLHARAGLERPAGGFAPLRQGCALVEVAGQAHVALHLHRLSNCGNGHLELPEQCDDGDGTARDGCNSRCVTEPGPVLPDRSSGQWPLAAAQGDLMAVCWQEPAPQERSMLLLLDGQGAPQEVVSDKAVSLGACTSVDLQDDRFLFVLARHWATNVGPTVMVGQLGVPSLTATVEIPGRTVVEMVAAFIGPDSLVAAMISAGDGGPRVSLQPMEVTDRLVQGPPLAVEAPGGGLSSLALAGADHHFLLVWATDEGDIWAWHSGDTGQRDGAFSLCRGPGCARPSAAWLDEARGREGQYGVVYEAPSGAIMGRLISALGTAGPAFAISSQAGCQAPVIAPGEGLFVAAWAEQRDLDQSAGLTDVMVRLVEGVEWFGFLATGGTVTDRPYRVTAGKGAAFGQPALAFPRGAAAPGGGWVFYQRAGEATGDGAHEAGDIARRLVGPAGGRIFSQ